MSSVNVLKGTPLGAVTSACVTCVCCSDCQVCHEVFGQEKDQNEAGGDSRTQRENHAVISEHRGELHTMSAPTKVCFVFLNTQHMFLKTEFSTLQYGIPVKQSY